MKLTKAEIFWQLVLIHMLEGCKYMKGKHDCSPNTFIKKILCY